jgi:hypothetical protein
MKNLVKMHEMNKVKEAERISAPGPWCWSQEHCVLDIVRLHFYPSVEFVHALNCIALYCI